MSATVYQEISDFIENWELDTGEGIWNPSPAERFLIEQFFWDVVNDDDMAENIKYLLNVQEVK